MTILTLAFAIAGSILASCFLCRSAFRIASKFALLDIPNRRKNHLHVTPLMGGIVLLAVFVPVSLPSIVSLAAPIHHSKLFICVAVVFSMTFIGILDDRHSLSPRVRLWLSFAVFGCAAYFEPIFNVRVLDFEHPHLTFGLGTRGLAIAFTIFCCVGLVNAVNMADGKNGLVIGLCIGWLVLLMLRAPLEFIPIISLLLAVLGVLLSFNLRGKLFLGDGGAYGLASAIAMIAIAVYNSPGAHATRAMAAEELVLLFAVPVLDSCRLTFKRVRKGLSPMAADRDHLHHHMQERFGWPTGLLLYWTLAILPNFLVYVSEIYA
ncbi:glycosyltransferase family 4 protein [Sphingorhabdus buctiana]|uniref:Glycosyltransferase family 4 protein n=1 Tax=Sphingorhabdus buctiana TaxID=1508805 RepID=A0ABW4MB61_9SPHN